MTSMHPSQRGTIRPFEVMEAYREAAAAQASGKDVVHLSLGQPGKGAPPPVLEHLSQLLSHFTPGYTDARGIPELRQRITLHYRERYGLEIAPERIVVTVGSSAAYFLSLIAAFDAGAKLAIARPCYPAYPNMMQGLNLAPVFIDTDAAHNFQPDWPMVEAVAPDVEGLVLASPSNPTGSIIRRESMQALAEGCEQRGVRIISDEIYHGVTYEHAATSVLEFSNRHIVVNSFSKYFLLPGWRLGWAVIPPDLVRSFESLLQSFFISPPAASQHAALKVFDCLGELDAEVARYAKNRTLLREGLRKAGITGLSEAEGAFYIYADVRHLTDDSKAFCRRMLHEAGVCAIPGNDFDEARGHHYVRFSFSGAQADIEQAVARIQAWLAISPSP